MIEHIHERVAALPADLQDMFNDIFYVNVSAGRALPPPEMEPWVIRQFGAVAAVRDQTIVNVTNRLTLEGALFNPLRARRPSQSATDDAALEAWIAHELAELDIFRDPERDTTADVFGRVRGRYCVTASNVAKYEGWHGLVIFDEPHPLRFGPAQVEDYLDTALRWIAAAHGQDPAAIYPTITWNCLPKSGATIMHGHMQVALAHGMPYARTELWRRAAASYRSTTGRGYFDDLLALHETLDLAITRAGGMRSFAHLTPLRNREIVFLADSGARERESERAGEKRRTHSFTPPLPYPPTIVSSLATTIAHVLRQLIEAQGMRAFNLAIALPPLGTAPAEWAGMPIVARVGDRGNPLSERSDIGAMELFAAGCVTADPFEVAAALRQASGDS